MPIPDDRKLRVWQSSMELAILTHRLARRLPPADRDLAAQLCAAAISVPANIAEGNASLTTRNYLRCISIARGSLAELSTLLELSVQLGFIPESSATESAVLIDHTARMLTKLAVGLRKRIDAQSPRREARGAFGMVARKNGAETPKLIRESSARSSGPRKV